MAKKKIPAWVVTYVLLTLFMIFVTVTSLYSLDHSETPLYNYLSLAVMVFSWFMLINFWWIFPLIDKFNRWCRG